ncbi:uncharacterized protein ACB058_002218 [Synchiropus picturatus]
MVPTRMKLRVRRRANVSADAAGDDRPSEEEPRNRASASRSRRKKTSNSSTAVGASSSPPPSSSASASARTLAPEEASPDSKCPICLDRFNNLAYLDLCLHRFCFPCIQEWSHNKAECPLCKQPFTSILHSVRAEGEFKEYVLRPQPTNRSDAVTVATVATVGSDHQMRLMLRRHRANDGGETTSRRRRRVRGGQNPNGAERPAVWEWYLDPPMIPHHPVPPASAGDFEEGEVPDARSRVDAERGVIFDGLTALGGTAASVAPNNRASRRLMSRLAARLRVQREGGLVRPLREREAIAFRRSLYRSSIQVTGIAGVNGHQQQQDVSAESFRCNPVALHRLRPWLRRELTVLYGAHSSLVDIVQRFIMSCLVRHGLQEVRVLEDEMRPFLLARTNHFLHELICFARSPLSLDLYDQQAVYEPLSAAMEIDGSSTSSDSSSVIAISEGEENAETTTMRPEEELLGDVARDSANGIHSGSNLSLSGWDDDTPGPSYSTAEQSGTLPSDSLSPPSKANENAKEKPADEEGEEECLIIGYKKPIAERTPELVQLSSDSEVDDEKKVEKAADKTPPPSYLPAISASTSGACQDEQQTTVSKEAQEKGSRLHPDSWSDSSDSSAISVCAVSPPEATWRSKQRHKLNRKRSHCDASRERRKVKKRKADRPHHLRKHGAHSNRDHSRSSSPLYSSIDSNSPASPSLLHSRRDYFCSQDSPFASSFSSSSSSSPSSFCSSPRPSSPVLNTSTTPSMSPGFQDHCEEKPGGKRKYKSRHLEDDPCYKPPGSRNQGKRKRGERERKTRERSSTRARRVGNGGRRSRRCQEERSPSVEIIYEGTVNSTTRASHKPHKRRNRTQQNSCPLIITIDSDESQAGIISEGSGCSSPISSQKTVDFSDIPPLPLAPSESVGTTVDNDAAELPADILERRSDGSEVESSQRSKSQNLLTLDSDFDLDVTDDRDLPPVRPEPVGNDLRGTERGGVGVEAGGPEDVPSYSDLLVKVLNDLEGLAAKSGPHLNSAARCVSETTKSEAATKQSGEETSDAVRFHSSFLPLPPLQLHKAECPQQLKETGPIQTHSNAPPPLKYKNSGSPTSYREVIPPITSLKQHFAQTLALKQQGSCTSPAAESLSLLLPDPLSPANSHMLPCPSRGTSVSRHQPFSSHLSVASPGHRHTTVSPVERDDQTLSSKEKPTSSKSTSESVRTCASSPAVPSDLQLSSEATTAVPLMESTGSLNSTCSLVPSAVLTASERFSPAVHTRPPEPDSYTVASPHEEREPPHANNTLHKHLNHQSAASKSQLLSTRPQTDSKSLNHYEPGPLAHSSTLHVPSHLHTPSPTHT